jgi:hypothetical protein
MLVSNEIETNISKISIIQPSPHPLTSSEAHLHHDLAAPDSLPARLRHLKIFSAQQSSPQLFLLRPHPQLACTSFEDILGFL